jgi:hypothetical protein
MAIEFTEITENSPAITWSDREILLHLLQHAEDLDARLAVLEQLCVVTSVKVNAMHEELEAARPMLEKWQHSRIIKYAAGLRGGTWQT